MTPLFQLTLDERQAGIIAKAESKIAKHQKHQADCHAALETLRAG
jgi:hypothetical protein